MNEQKHKSMKTQFTPYWNLGNRSTEAMNDEAITEKILQTLEEWNEQGRASNLNRFKSAGTNTSSKKLAQLASGSTKDSKLPDE